MKWEKQYLGDSVYAEYDGWMVKLTTENLPGSPSNTIFLEPQVYKALQDYVKALKTEEE